MFPFATASSSLGPFESGQAERKCGWIYSVRILADNGFPDGRRLERRARAAGLCRCDTNRPRQVLVIGARDLHELTLAALAEDPWFTARGPAGDPIDLEAERVGHAYPVRSASTAASMREMVEALWRLPRDIVSDGYDAALEALATQVPMTIHGYPTGLECWTWIVPEKWTCHEAYLETPRWSAGVLLRRSPAARGFVFAAVRGRGIAGEPCSATSTCTRRCQTRFPFVFKYYERDWGLCCSRHARDQLTDERYRVVIRSQLPATATLKVGEVVAPGRSDQAIVLCAHLCHPGMANDDLTGVVVGIDVMRRLLQRTATATTPTGC